MQLDCSSLYQITKFNEALLTGLKLAKMLEAKDFIVQTNSQLVIDQVRGDYDVKKERM